MGSLTWPIIPRLVSITVCLVPRWDSRSIAFLKWWCLFKTATIPHMFLAFHKYSHRFFLGDWQVGIARNIIPMIVDIRIARDNPLHLVRDHMDAFFLDRVHSRPGDPGHQQVHNPLDNSSAVGEVPMGFAPTLS